MTLLLSPVGILISSAICIIIGFIMLFISRHLRNKVINLIDTDVVQENLTIINLQVTKPMLDELERICLQKFHNNIVITNEIMSKNRINVRLNNPHIQNSYDHLVIPSAPALGLLISQDRHSQKVRELSDYLYWTEAYSTLSVIAVFLGLFSLFALATDSMKLAWDKIAVLLLPVASLLFIPLMYFTNHIRKKRNIAIKADK